MKYGDSVQGNKQTCFIIGHTSLAIQCCKQLQSMNFAILAVISDDEDVRRWAGKNGIVSKNFDMPQVRELLGSESFDYLFSIVNNYILPDSFLRLACKLAINYHDAPLPKYAGLNASAWAIYNKEKQHGVTWHVMEEHLDTGDILKQEMFPIAHDETSFTLNAKCYEHAIKSFAVLLGELKNSSYKRIKQDISRRSYFGRYNKISGAGFITWDMHVSDIDCLVRSLDFGDYPNTLGIAKLCIKDTIYFVEQLHCFAEVHSNFVGLVEFTDSANIFIYVVGGYIQVNKLNIVDGGSIDSQELCLRHGIVDGEILPVFEKANIALLSEKELALAKAEQNWVRVLSSLRPIDIPYQPDQNSLAVKARIKKVSLDFGLSDIALARVSVDQYLYAASWILFLAKINSTSAFELGLDSSDLQPMTMHVKSLLQKVVPLTIQLDFSCSVSECLQLVSTSIKKSCLAEGFNKELCSRYPQLQAIVDSEFCCSQPILLRFSHTISVDNTFAKNHKLVLVLDPESGKKTLFYNTGYITDYELNFLLDAYAAFIDNLAKYPASSLSSLAYLLPLEKEAMLHEWNSTSKQGVLENDVIALFEKQLENDCSAVAVRFNNKSMTYDDLDKASNKLANFLIGVYPEIANKSSPSNAMVPICMLRGCNMVIAIFAILKLGAAYVPLDSRAPRERVKYILKDVNAQFILVDTNTSGSPCLEVDDIKLIDMDDCAVHAAHDTRVNFLKSSTDLAYVIYTSGTTGTPKGVMIEHAALSNRLLWMRDAYGFKSFDRVLQKTPYIFDVSVWEIILPLIVGARIVFMQEDGHKSPQKISMTIQSEKITRIHFVPSMLDAYLDYVADNCDASHHSSLKSIYCSGETLTLKLYNKFKCLDLNVNLHNLYGPTEAAIDVSSFECCGDLTMIAIGKPINNIKIYILDKFLNPVPIGIPGEIYISGVGLARGYLNQDDLTEEKFISNPFSSRYDGSFQKMYKTGDIARWLADGNIDYIGRNDLQVKVRGFRIDLGEVEKALLNHPNIMNAAVVCRTLRGQNHMVAYYTAHKHLSVEDIACFIQNFIPEYMLPSYYMQLNEMPITVNGKLDRSSLTKIDFVRDSEYVMPRNELEAKVCDVFANILSMENYGIKDDFFLSGGNSLLAMQLVSRLRADFSMNIDVVDIFKGRCVASIMDMVGAPKSHNKSEYSNSLKCITRNAVSYPVSYSQKRMWFIDQYEAGNVAYNLHHSFRLKGFINTDILNTSLQMMAHRNEMLRTIFSQGSSGDPIQIIMDERELQLEVTDLSKKQQHDCLHLVNELIQNYLLEPFDLSRGPLWRAVLFMLPSNEYVFTILMHHIITDLWSLQLFCSELGKIYNALTDKTALPPLAKYDYLDYVCWQLNNETVIADKAQYWINKLSGDIPILNLPYDFPRPSLRTFNGGSVTAILDASSTAKLKGISQVESATLFSFLLSVFAVVLSRYSNQEEVFIGSPVANRSASSVENIMGLFVNTVVLRNDLSGDPTFRELLIRTNKLALEVYKNHGVPFEYLVEKLRIERDLQRSAIFDVMFVMQNITSESLDIKGVEASAFTVYPKTSKFDLTLFCEEVADGTLKLALEYNTDLFKNQTAVGLLDHYLVLVKNILIDINKPVLSYPMLGQSEIIKISQINDTRTYFPDSCALHADFMLHAKQNPAAVAVHYKDKALSYGELDIMSSRLAEEIIDCNSQCNELVAIVMEKSWDQVVAVLAVIKAGSAYLPINAHYPEQRITDLLIQGEAKIILTHSNALVPRPKGIHVIACDQDRLTRPAVRKQPMIKHKNSNLAYVIFTSGSTGKPKGVMLSHENALNTIYDMNARFAVSPSDCILGLSSLDFDLSVYDIFGALSVGAKLVLPEQSQVKDEKSWYYLLLKYNVTIWNSTPALMEMMVSYIESTHNTGVSCSLRLVLLSGDWIPPALPKRIRSIFGASVQVISLGGATEGSIWSIIYPVKPAARFDASIPYGKPMANQAFYILNEKLQSCPFGVAGELYIGGKGVAQGYWRDAEKTRSRFIIHRQTKERLYRTGDLGRFLSDGNIEFLGRIDNQVKIRGYRVELGEIEASLKEHPGIVDAVVFANQKEKNKTHLSAYYIVSDDFVVDKNDLRMHLQASLPIYMIPSAYMQLDSFPVSANGKISKKHFPPINISVPSGVTKYIAPANELEERVVKIWSAVLNIPEDKIGVNDSFFELGGHSLLAMKIMTNINKQFCVRLTVRNLFENKTISTLASLIINDECISDVLAVHNESEDMLLTGEEV